MKKILFAAFAFAAICLNSCGNMTQSSNATDSTAVDTAVVDSVDTTAVDTFSVDSTSAE